MSELADVDAVDEDAAAIHVVETQQQADDRGLARPGRADDADALAGLDDERDVAQDVVVLLVREPHVIELDAAARRRRAPRRHGRRRQLDGRVEQREDPLGRRHRRLQDVELLGQVADRLEEAPRVLQKRDEHADADDAVERPAAADPDDEGARQRGDDFNRRVEHRVVEDRRDVDVAVAAVDRVELLERARLLGKELHRRDAGDVLLQKRVEPRDQAAHLAVRLAHVLAEPRGHRPRSPAARRTRRAPAASSSRASRS